jgi:hypothetical protein
MAAITASIEELAPVVGADGARALMMAFAGRRIYVPKEIGEHHPIAAAVGLEKARKVAEYYQCTHLEFPIAAAKRRQVLDLAAQGLSDSAISARVWLTERRVRQVRAEARAARQDQLKLLI